MEPLENLTLEIEASPKLDDFNAIIQLTKTLHSLKGFELKFKGSQLTDQQVNNLCLHIFQMSSLRTLSFDLEQCQVSQTAFEIFIKLNSSSSISSLIKLKLVLAEGPKEKKKASSFLASLKKIFKQEEEENKREIEEFWRFLRSLKELKSLNLKFRNMDFGNKEQREFANGLWMLGHLEESQMKFEYDHVEKGKLRRFENLILKSGYLRTLMLQFKEKEDRILEKDVRIFDFEVPGCGLSFQLKLSFRKCYNEARAEIALLSNLADFFEKIGSIAIGRQRRQSLEALSSICVDEKELEFIEVLTSADQSPEILKKL